MRPQVKFVLAVFSTSLLLVLLLVYHVGVFSQAQGFYEGEGITQDVEFIQNMRRKQEVRKRLVRKVCQRNDVFPETNNVHPNKLKFIFVDDHYKFMYCFVPKVACTNWKRVLVVLSGQVNTTNPMELKSPDVHHKGVLTSHLKSLDSYSEQDIQFRLKHYFKFMFVRNPMERILSAYRNKFTMSYNTYFPTKYGKNIVKKYRDNPSNKSLQLGNDVAFEEFIKYLLDPQTPKPFNSHWAQYYKLCHPCLVNYDVVGKYENLDEEADYVLRELVLEDVVKFPRANRWPGQVGTGEMMRKFYSNISSETIHKLWELYSVDYAMFGYDYPDFHKH